LNRSEFIGPDFDPKTFLANLSDRYQTIEDLRSELQELGRSLGSELSDLVNHNYQAFLSLGGTLQGGEEKVEEIRLGLLGFQRELTSVRDNVDSRRKEIAGLIHEKTLLMARIQKGKSLLCIAEQIEHLEANLMIAVNDESTRSNMQYEEFSDDSDAGEGTDGVSMRHLDRHVEQYLILRLLLQRHNPSQPYIANQTDRIARIKSILRLDVEGALKQTREVHKGRPAATSPRVDSLEELLQAIDEEQPNNNE
jgi:conserved oligomeric Golgi complex subunit 2